MGFFDRPTTRILRRREWIPSGKAGSRNEGGNNGNGGGNNGGGNNGGGGNPSPPGGGGPKLTSPTGTTTGATTADLSVTTNRGNGTLYWVVTISSTAPTKAQVKAGQNEAGAAAPDSGSQAVSATGAQAITGGATGLTAETAYFAHFMHEAANGSQSAVATSATFTTDAAATTPLDGLSGLTGAWSASRPLLAAYAGDLYTLNAGRVETLHDQSGNSRDFAQSTGAQRPTIVTAGGSSREALDFVAASVLHMNSTATLADFINNNAGYIVVSFIADLFTANNSSIGLNDVVICDDGLFAGVCVRNTAGGTVYSYNWDGSYDSGSTVITTATAYVVEWRHDGGSIFNRVNAGTESSALSGNTTTLTGIMRLGADGGSSLPFDGKIFEIAIFDTVPIEATRNALVADMMDWIGAA